MLNSALTTPYAVRRTLSWVILTFEPASAGGDAALRSLRRTPMLWATIAFTLALGIGMNTAIFSVVRGVLLRPLMNRDEDRLIFIQQSAPGLQVSNATFS